MCNEYTESVLHPSERKSQIVQNTIEQHYGKKHSTDCSSNYSGKLFHNLSLWHSSFPQDSHCQTYEQQWQTIIQNGQINLSRVQTIDEGTQHQNNGTTTTATTSKKDSHHSVPVDHNIHSKVQFQLDMLDCNYEQDKREYYAQLIRDLKKTSSIHELDRQLKNQVKYFFFSNKFLRTIIHSRKVNIGN